MTNEPRTPTLGDNSRSYSEILADDPAVAFSDPKVVDAFFAEIEKSVLVMAVDLKTEAGRKAIASMAHGIARRKTALDEAGKALNEGSRAKINEVDSVRRRIREQLDALRDKAREPLDKWEAEQEARRADVLARLKTLEGLSVVLAGSTPDQIEAALDHALRTECGPEHFDELSQRAAMARTMAIDVLAAAHSAAVKAEDEKAELEKLRKQAEEQRLRDAEAEKKRLDDLAEARRQEIADAAAKQRADAAAQAAIDAANREAEKLRLEALNREREAQRLKDDEARRAADRKHRSAVMKAAKEALMAKAGISEEVAVTIVKAIGSGQIPNVSLSF